MIKVIARNKKVKFDYFVEGEIEAGIVLLGSEVKSIRGGFTNLADSHVSIDFKGRAVVYNLYIKEYSHANIQNHEPRRTRQLLLHKKEIQKILQHSTRKGYTLIPSEIYFKGKFIKLKVALCKSKKQYDKRDTLKEKDVKREMDRVSKSFNGK